MPDKCFSRETVIAAAIAVAMAGATLSASVEAGELRDSQPADVKLNEKKAENVSTTGVTGRTNTSYTTTNDKRVQTHGLTGRTNTSYQPAPGIGHANGLTGRTNF